MTTQQLTIAVIGAGGKMGMRVSNNLQRSNHTVYTARTHPPGSSALLMPDGRLPTRRLPWPRLMSSSSLCPTSRSHRCRSSSAAAGIWQHRAHA